MRKGRARLLGVLALVAGIAGAVALWLLADKRYDDAVADLAPAPIGCDTTLVFDRTGTYTFFVETVGSVGEIDGDCEADDRQYDIGDDDVPDVELVLRDNGGDEVDLDRVSGPTYDRSGAKGTGVSIAEIEDTGDYLLTASSADADVMIRVGRDPSGGVTAMRVGAIAALVAGVGLFIVGMTRAGRRPAAGMGGAGFHQWPPTGPIARPIAPPYANPPGAPPYGMPPPPQQHPGPAGPPGEPWPGREHSLPPPSSP